jgi:dTDP-D-glucose 4,6-dehydratase
MPKTNFIGEIMNSAINTGRVDFQTTPESTKDYISIKDVIRWLPEIALRGRHTIYNVASGCNTSNHKISKFLEQKKIKVNFMKDAVTWSFREINIDRLVEEFNPPQHSLLNEFDDLFSSFSNHK